jgi:uncharacterized protein (TIGR00369 family)
MAPGGWHLSKQGLRRSWRIATDNTPFCPGTTMMKKLNPEYVSELIERVNSSPFPRHLPFSLAAVGPDEAVVEMTATQHHLQPLGTVHGGVLATLIDTATYWAAFIRLPADVGMVNVDLKLNYLRPAATGLLRTEGRCLQSGRSVSYAEASVKDGNGKLIAHGTSTLLALPGQGLSLAAMKFLDHD